MPTHVAGMLDFANGAIGTIIDQLRRVGRRRCRCIEIYGTQGSLSVPDPNGFGGPVSLHAPGGGVEGDAADPRLRGNSRGIGVADMAYALRSGRPHRASGELAFHVLDIMHAVHEARCRASMCN